MPVQATAYAPSYYPRLLTPALQGQGSSREPKKKNRAKQAAQGSSAQDRGPLNELWGDRCRDLLKIGRDRDLLVADVVEISVKNYSEPSC